jgi:hypothetical protein
MRSLPSSEARAVLMTRGLISIEVVKKATNYNGCRMIPLGDNLLESLYLPSHCTGKSRS